MRPGKRMLSLGLGFAVGGVAVGTAATLVVLEHHRFSQLIVGKSQELLATQAQLSARRIEQFFLDHATALDMLIDATSATACAAPPSAATAACGYGAALGAFAAAHRDDVAGVAIVDPAGHVVSRAAPALRDLSVVLPPAEVLQALRRGGRTAFVAGRTQAGGRPALSLWRSLPGEGQVAGYAAVEMNLGQIYQRFFQRLLLGREACSWVIDRSGTVVAHHKPAEIGKPFLQTKTRHLSGDNLRDVQAMFRRATAGESGTAMFTCPEEGRRIAVFSPASFGDVLWSVGVTIGYDDIAEPIDRHLQSSIGVSASTLMLLGLMGYGWRRSRRRSARLELEAELLRQVADSATALQESEARNRRLEERLRAAQQLESLGNLAAGIAHDYNNMLTAILGYLSVARDQRSGEPELVSTLQRAELAAQRARELTARLLTLSRGGEPVFRGVDLPALVRETVGMVSAAAHCPARVEVEGVDKVEIDATQVQQALLAILTNAVEATDGTGALEVEVSHVALGADSEVPLPAGDYARVRCADRGSGVDPTLARSIFDPYVSTKALGVEHGRGLGLTVAHSIVVRHRGHISFGDRPGGGTTFDVYLPLRQPAASSAPPRDARPSAGTARVLVMDDDEVVCELAELIYRRLGFEAATVRDGHQALQRYALACEQGQPFDLVVLDLSVPGGMGGLETLRRLQEIDPGVQAVVSSGYSDDPVTARFAEHGFCDVLPKPYAIEDVRKMLERVLRRG